MFYMFKLGHNIAEATENICCANYSTETRWFKKLWLGCKKLDDHIRSDRPKSVDYAAMLQAIEANTASSTWRVSGKFFTVHFGLLPSKLQQKYREVCLTLLRYCKTFDSPSYFKLIYIFMRINSQAN